MATNGELLFTCESELPPFAARSRRRLRLLLVLGRTFSFSRPRWAQRRASCSCLPGSLGPGGAGPWRPRSPRRGRRPRGQQPPAPLPSGARPCGRGQLLRLRGVVRRGGQTWRRGTSACWPGNLCSGRKVRLRHWPKTLVFGLRGGGGLLRKGGSGSTPSALLRREPKLLLTMRGSVVTCFMVE